MNIKGIEVSESDLALIVHSAFVRMGNVLNEPVFIVNFTPEDINRYKTVMKIANDIWINCSDREENKHLKKKITL